MKQLLSRLLIAASLVLVGCATSPMANPKDPWEPMNRKVASFNDTIDDNVLKPVATGYRNVVPELIQTGVRNVFNNLSDMWSTVNNALQLKPIHAVESLGRVVVNTVFGIYGIFDVATYLKLERHPEDFGQTLGYWACPMAPTLFCHFSDHPLCAMGPACPLILRSAPPSSSMTYQRATKCLLYVCSVSAQSF